MGICQPRTLVAVPPYVVTLVNAGVGVTLAVVGAIAFSFRTLSRTTAALALAYFGRRGRPRAFASTAVLSGCAAFVLVTVTIMGFSLN
jgi:hypothetical protein